MSGQKIPKQQLPMILGQMTKANFDLCLSGVQAQFQCFLNERTELYTL